MVIAIPLNVYASKVGLVVESCKVFEPNPQFVLVNEGLDTEYLIKAESGLNSCSVLQSKDYVGGYKSSSCEFLASSYSGINCEDRNLEEFLIPVWPKELDSERSSDTDNNSSD